MKQYLKPRAAKQSELGAILVTACLLKNEPASYTFVARAKAGSCRSRRETESEQGVPRFLVRRGGGRG